MATRVSREELPLIVIVGPTASGKTSVAIELASRYNGEIICADSRTVYKEMDIGTAKPTPLEQAQVPHWGINLVQPGRKFTAADFQQYAKQKIKEIRARGRTPFLVGGTGLYVDAILFNYVFTGSINQKLREKLAPMTTAELISYCLSNNIELPKDTANKRRLVRAIEQNGINRRRESSPISNTIIVGIATEKAVLHKRIAQRAEQLFKDGVVDEAINLGRRYGWDSEAFTGNIYAVVRQYLAGELPADNMKERSIVLDRQLAKRQVTWFKRNSFIQWLPLSDVVDYVAKQLALRNKA